MPAWTWGLSTTTGKSSTLEDGTYNIKNTGRGNYMEWYAQIQ